MVKVTPLLDSTNRSSMKSCLREPTSMGGDSPSPAGKSPGIESREENKLANEQARIRQRFFNALLHLPDQNADRFHVVAEVVRLWPQHAKGQSLTTSATNFFNGAAHDSRLTKLSF